MKNAVLVFDSQALAGGKAARDVGDQMDVVENALRQLGWDATRLPVDLNLWRFKKRIFSLRPTLVFNLVESLDRSDRLQTVVPMVLEEWRLPFTGAGAAGMLLANQKIASKRTLADKGLPFPGCAWLAGGGELAFMDGDGGEEGAGDWIIKSVDSHASAFLDDASVVRNAGRAELAERLSEAEAKHGERFFAERFIDGREFNLSVLEGAGGRPEALPVSEISFATLPPDRPRIVGHAAKWDEDSPEYRDTPRVYPENPEDAGLLAELSRLALAAWEAFGLAGYARVDFRVDAAGRPYILEANANPCLTPGAGFPAAAERAGMEYAELVRRIAEAGLRRG